MEVPEKQNKPRNATMLAVIVVIFSIVSGGLLGYSICYSTTAGNFDSLERQISALQEQIGQLQSTQTMNSQNLTLYTTETVSVSQLYDQIADSVVVIRGMQFSGYDIFRRSIYSQVQGSGFVYNNTGEIVVITNYHVAGEATNITVTFSNGNTYPAGVLGSDPYAELAVLSVQAYEKEYVPLEIASSSNLKVGDQVMVVGTPYGLAGSMSTGFVSALGRTLSAETTGGYVIANVIQTTAPLNPGNSGGPVLNYQGQVVGIATAIVQDSQGVGFAIPSNTILREIGDLVKKGSYNNHPWLGVSGTDMSYEIAEKMGINVTYGWLVASTASGGPADKAGLQGGTSQVQIGNEIVVVGGDIIIEINGVRITNMDDMSAYLEEYTLPGQTIQITILRDNLEDNISLELESRPTSSTST